MGSITSLSWLADDEGFLGLFQKMILGKRLSDNEYAYLLSCAILLIRFYESDRRRTTHFELGYFIILIYSNLTEDFSPLLDVSTNFGYYPISKFIIDKNLQVDESIQRFLVEKKLESFNHNGITETFEQQKYRRALLSSDEQESSYVAPTSFGKSSLFIEVIKSHRPKKVAIIVPTKSLLTQTYRNIDRNFPDSKIIFHDEMYGDEQEFIAVFTQERALRLMKDPEISFDMLIIDEAHNIFEYSSRSILLTRLIRRNRRRNSNSKVYYFSPLISDSQNLKLESNQKIDERTIRFNIKEPMLFECKEDGSSFTYSRFLDQFFSTDSWKDYLQYIVQNAKKNNFIYLNAPRKVEGFSKLLAEQLDNTESEELQNLSKTISKNVHEDFYAVDLVKKGIIYLHGKLPDLVKEYLESKFRNTEMLHFIIANKVILEGVNLPVDNLYILNARGLQGKDLINLIGRVNRLNEVFDRDKGGLEKLLPPVHFVTSEFAGAKANMRNKMRELKSSVFKDEVKNPILLNYDFEKLEKRIETTSSDDERNRAIDEKDLALRTRSKEDFLINHSYEDEEQILALLMESNIDYAYANTDLLLEEVSSRAALVKRNSDWHQLDVVEKVYEIFIRDLEESIVDTIFLRLRNIAARNFYRVFVKNLHALTLKEHINETVRYFYSISSSASGKRFYIGHSYGELTRDENYYQQTYIDLSSKTHKELVNLALVKIKMESDFVSYKLNDYISLLRDMELIGEDEYNQFIYGTSKKLNSDFTKLGFSGTLIAKLEKDKQLTNIIVNELGHVTVNDEFREYLSKQDDLVKFEVNKYIDLYR